MTYVSHTVRSLRRDPIPDETIRLVLTLGEEGSAADASTADASAEASAAEAETDDESSVSAVAVEVCESVESLGGEVVRELPFDRLLVEIDQTELDAICELDGVTAVETDAVLDQT